MREVSNCQPLFLCITKFAVFVLSSVLNFPSVALTLLAHCHKGHLACKNSCYVSAVRFSSGGLI